MTAVVVDLFAGPGGWDEGLRLLGYEGRVVGVEWDARACSSAMEAGHDRIHGDVTLIQPEDVLREGEVLEGLIASPPCQTFSQAGKGEGRSALETLIAAAEEVAAGASVEDALQEYGGDERSALVLQPLVWVRDASPEWVAFENVQGVLPVWKSYEHIMEGLGYEVWAGKLNAADYGVPQSRKRAFLLAHKRGLDLPRPTHSEDEWVTMAEALNLGERPDGLEAWAWDRPATTVVRSFCPDIISAPGYRKKGDGPRQKAPGSIRVTEEQMMTLQGVRADYPVHGPKTKRQSLIGAFLPPPWAAAILSPLIERSRCGHSEDMDIRVA